MKIIEIIDLAKRKAGLESDYKLAKAMGIQPSIIAHWRKKRRHPSTEEAVQLAALSGIEDTQIIAWINVESATSEKKKKFWKGYIESRGLVATVGLCALGISIIALPEKTDSSILQLHDYDANTHALNTNRIYIMRN